jgi:hypothetical protein
MKIDGSCHCGKITLTAEVDPATTMTCHCVDCQILGGGPCRTGIPSAAENVNIEGEPAEYIKVAESGRKRVQGFCGACGTSLYAADEDKTKFIVRLGFLNQREQLIPTKHIYQDSSASWLKGIEQQQWFARMP